MPPLLIDLLSIVGILLALILALAWLLAGEVIKRRPPDPESLPSKYGILFDHVTFSARDGVELAGRFSGEEGRRPTIIFCAGMFGSMDGDTHFVPDFVKAGFDVFQFDWRGHGLSDGARNTLALEEVDDLLGAVDWLQARGVMRIGLMGFSLGGAVALRAAAQDARVLCVVCDGGFVHIEHALYGYVAKRVRLPLRPLLWIALRFVEVRLGRRLSQASPLPTVGQIAPRPVLFVHGADDALVPPSDQEALYAACGEPKTLWQVEGAGHREAHEREREEYVRRVVGFFRQNLLT